MNRSALVMVFFALSVAPHAQERQEGTWSGTLQRVGPNNQQRQVQKVSIEFKKAPDPHWVWRPDGGDVWVTTFVSPQGRAPLMDLQMEHETIAFGYMRDDVRVNCRLRQQADDTFHGDCVGDGDSLVFRITLSPPAAAKK